MASDARLDALKAERDRLDAAIRRMQEDGAISSNMGTFWSLNRIQYEVLRRERDLVNLKYMSRLALINGRDLLFGGSFRRRITVKDTSDDTT